MLPLPRLITLCLVAAAAAACTTDEQALDYTVSGGLAGQGDGTALSIDLHDGEVTQHAGGNTVHLVLAPAELAHLQQLVADAQFPTLAPEYHCSCSDMYVRAVEVRLGGAAHRVAVDDTAAVPSPLQSLLELLRALSVRAPAAP